jgi:outer membrane usher protein
VKTTLFPALGSDNKTCANIQVIPQASVDFQFSQQRLVLSIPQAALSGQARGYVPPEQWDDGITAAMLNYSLSGANSWGRNGSSSDAHSQYANLRPGINVGPWRLRNYSTWTRDANGQNRWDTVYSYVQRSVTPLRAQLTLGETLHLPTCSIACRFVAFSLPLTTTCCRTHLKAMRRWCAGSHEQTPRSLFARTGIRFIRALWRRARLKSPICIQRGAGDLDVTIKEVDGSEQRFTVPYASLPVLQREGHVKFALTGGQYRSYNSDVQGTPFAQLTGIIGLPYGLTFYNGLQESSKYQSLAAGMGKNMGDFGAMSVDMTQGWATPQGGQKSNGQSWRARYSKNIVASGTQFSIAGYRYSTSGYYAMQDVLDSYGDSTALRERRRNREELTMSQSLGNQLGSVMLSAAREDYWSGEKSMAS